MEEIKTRKEIIKMISEIDEEISRLNILRSEFVDKLFDTPLTEEDIETNKKWIKKIMEMPHERN
jgi:hypothetical protein